MKNNIFQIGDILQLIKVKKAKILIFCTFFTFIFLIFLLSFYPSYNAKALYESSKENSSKDNRSDLVIQMTKTQEQSQECIIMKSRKILFPVIKEMGLQTEVKKNNFLLNFIHAAKANFLAEFFQDNQSENIYFENVEFNRKKKAYFIINFDSKNTFFIREKNNKKTSYGILKENIIHNDFSFLIKKIPKNIKLHQDYLIKVSPILTSYKKLCNNFKIIPDKNNKNFLFMNYKHKDRDLSKAVINKIMKKYQTYCFKKKNDIEKKQTDFFNKRISDIQKRLETEFDKLSNDDEVFFLKNQIHLITSKYFELSEKKNHLDNLINQYENDFEKVNDTEIFQMKKAKKELLNEKNNILSDTSFHLSDKENLFLMLNWAKNKYFYHEINDKMDVDSAKQLRLQCIDKKHLIQLELSKYESLIDTPLKDLSVYTSLYSKKLIEDLISLFEKNKFKKYLFSKEKNEIEESIKQISSDLKNCLINKIEAKKQSIYLIKKQILNLNDIIFNKINNDIKIIDDQIKNLSESKLFSLVNERKVVEIELDEILKTIKSYRQKIIKEKEIDLQSEITVKLIDSLTKLIEPHFFNNQIYKNEKNTIDYAIASYIPAYPYIFIFSILVFMSSFCIILLIEIVICSYKGFFVSNAFLTSLGLTDLGSLTKKKNETICKIAHWIIKNKNKKTSKFFCFLSQYNYIEEISKVLSIDYKVLLIDLEFYDNKEKKALLYSFSKNSNYKIFKYDNYYEVAFEPKFYENIPKFLKSKVFNDTINNVINNYDIVLLKSSYSIDSYQTLLLIDYSKDLVITYDKLRVNSYNNLLLLIDKNNSQEIDLAFVEA